jgi:hypothetical protein
MRSVLVTIALIATVNGFGFFENKEDQDLTKSLISFLASDPVAANPSEINLITSDDIYDNYVKDVLKCYDKNGNG